MSVYHYYYVKNKGHEQNIKAYWYATCSLNSNNNNNKDNPHRHHNNHNVEEAKSVSVVTVYFEKVCHWSLSSVVQSSNGETCHGRLLLEVEEGSVLTVIGQNGDPDLQLLCIQLHRAELHHNGNVWSA